VLIEICAVPAATPLSKQITDDSIVGSNVKAGLASGILHMGENLLQLGLLQD
jgi:hypothetical protein